MINGFVLDIVNENNEEVSISLFNNGEIQTGLTITARNSKYDYNSLFLMSINEGFIGCGISTDDKSISQVTIFKNGTPSTYEFCKILDGMEIIIDGLTNYITFLVRPKSKSLFQLIPHFK
jgi:hypothetical protein